MQMSKNLFGIGDKVDLKKSNNFEINNLLNEALGMVKFVEKKL